MNRRSVETFRGVEEVQESASREVVATGLTGNGELRTAADRVHVYENTSIP